MRNLFFVDRNNICKLKPFFSSAISGRTSPTPASPGVRGALGPGPWRGSQGSGSTSLPFPRSVVPCVGVILRWPLLVVTGWLQGLQPSHLRTVKFKGGRGAPVPHGLRSPQQTFTNRITSCRWEVSEFSRGSVSTGTGPPPPQAPRVHGAPVLASEAVTQPCAVCRTC